MLRAPYCGVLPLDPHLLVCLHFKCKRRTGLPFHRVTQQLLHNQLFESQLWIRFYMKSKERPTVTVMCFGSGPEREDMRLHFSFYPQEPRESYHQSLHHKWTACCHSYYLTKCIIVLGGICYNHNTVINNLESMMKQCAAIITVCALHASSLIYSFATKPFSSDNVIAVTLSRELLK